MGIGELGTSGLQDWGWRRVPKISLLPQGRAPLFSPLVLVLAVAVSAAAVLAAMLYGDVSSTKDLIVREQSKLVLAEERAGAAEGSVADAEGEIGALSSQIAEIEAQSGLEGQPLEQFKKARVNWGAALQSMFGADGPGITLTRVVTVPDGRLKVTGTFEGVDAVGRFNAYMRDVQEKLTLGNLQLEEGVETLIFTADVQVR